MKGFEAPIEDNIIEGNFDQDATGPLEVIPDATPEISPAVELFNFAQARGETSFEIRGRIYAIEQQIAQLRDSIGSMPESKIPEAKEEMARLINAFNKFDTLYKLKERGGNEEDLDLAA